MARVKRDRVGAGIDASSWSIGLWIIAIAAALFVLDFASAILLPTAYACILALVLAPVARGFSRLIGDGAAAVITVLMAAAAIVAIIALVAPAVGDWIADAPRMARSIDQKLQPLKEQLQIVEKVTARIQGTDPKAPAAAAADGGMFGSILSVGANFVSQLIYVMFLTLFLLALRTDLRRRVILCADTPGGRLRMGHAVRDIGKNVGGYLFILTCINVGVALVTAIAFYLAGIPNPVVWGVVYGLANYVPVIGPTGTILAAGLVGVANEPTLVMGLLGSGIMLFINAIESQAVQPWLMARRIEINPVAMFVALAFVVWLWGIPAAIISTPMLIVAYTFSKYAPPLEPIAAALAPVTKPKHEPPPPPPRRVRRAQAAAAKDRKATVPAKSATAA